MYSTPGSLLGCGRLATLGWPEKTPDLAKFYPGAVLVSGYDILFFWIARMIMAGIHFMGEIPYRDIFITGMIKDKQGRWMSKSLGNGHRSFGNDGGVWS